HVERVDGGPERFAFVDELLEQIVGDGAAALAARTAAQVRRRPELERQIVRLNHFTPAGDDDALDDVFQLADVARPRVLTENGERLGRDGAHRRAVRGAVAVS